MTQPVILNDGVVLSQQTMSAEFHLDSSSLFNMLGGQTSAPVTDMGVISLFAMSGLMGPKVGGFSFRTNRQFLSTHDFTWKTPIGTKEWAIVNVVSEGAELGVAGATFQVEMNGKQYDHNWVVGPDPSLKMHLHVTTDPIVQTDGDNHIYTFRVITPNNSTTGFPRHLLAPGTKMFGFYTLDGEYNTVLSSIPDFSMGIRKHMATVCTTEQQLYLSVTKDAAMKVMPANASIPYEAYQKALEFYKFAPDTLGYAFTTLSPQERAGKTIGEQYQKAYGKNAGSQLSRDTVLSTWLPLAEAIAVTYLGQMTQTKAFYGTGGGGSTEGVTQYGGLLGLWHQLMMGRRALYNLEHFNLGLLEAIITSALENTTNWDVTAEPPVIDIRCGRGALSMVKDQTRRQPQDAGMIWSADKYVLGATNSLLFDTPSITRWKMSNNLAILNFVWEPALDPVAASNITNPIVTYQNLPGGNRLSSYAFIIESLKKDVEAGVEELVYGPDYQIRKVVEQGKLAYPGYSNNGTHMGNPSLPGFKVAFYQRDTALWLKDPTASLMILPINAQTGKPVMSY